MNIKRLLFFATLLLPLIGLMCGWAASGLTLAKYNDVWLAGLAIGVSFMLAAWSLLAPMVWIPRCHCAVVGYGGSDAIKHVLPNGLKFVLPGLERVLLLVDTRSSLVSNRVTHVHSADAILFSLDYTVLYHVNPANIASKILRNLNINVFVYSDDIVMRAMKAAVHEVGSEAPAHQLVHRQVGKSLDKHLSEALQKRLAAIGISVDRVDVFEVLADQDYERSWTQSKTRRLRMVADCEGLASVATEIEHLPEHLQDVFDELTRMDGMGENGLNYPGPEYYPPRRNGRPKSAIVIP